MSGPRPLKIICKEITYYVTRSRLYPKKFREIYRRMLNNVNFCSRKEILDKNGVISSKSRQMGELKKKLENISTVTHLDDEMTELLTSLSVSRMNLKGLNFELLIKVKEINPVLYQEHENLVSERRENSTKLTEVIAELWADYPNFNLD